MYKLLFNKKNNKGQHLTFISLNFIFGIWFLRYLKIVSFLSKLKKMVTQKYTKIF